MAKVLHSGRETLGTIPAMTWLKITYRFSTKPHGHAHKQPHFLVLHIFASLPSKHFHSLFLATVVKDRRSQLSVAHIGKYCNS